MCALLSTFSTPFRVEPQQARAAANVAGSAIALLAAFADAFASANAAKANAEDAGPFHAMMAQSLGAASTMALNGMGWADIVRSIATPGGTTEAGHDTFRHEIAPLIDRVIRVIDERQKTIQM